MTHLRLNTSQKVHDSKKLDSGVCRALVYVKGEVARHPTSDPITCKFCDGTSRIPGLRQAPQPEPVESPDALRRVLAVRGRPGAKAINGSVVAMVARPDGSPILPLSAVALSIREYAMELVRLSVILEGAQPTQQGGPS